LAWALLFTAPSLWWCDEKNLSGDDDAHRALPD
jgi:hypothetical protein